MWLRPHRYIQVARFINGYKGGVLMTKLAEIPEWILATATDGKPTLGQLYTPTTGDRNQSLARLTGIWINQNPGISRDGLIEMGLAWNSGIPSPLPEAEVKRTCKSIFDKHNRENQDRDRRENTKPLTFELVQGSKIEPEDITWLWRDWLPCGKLVILAGQPGTGKTTVMMSIAAITTIGGRMPDGTNAESGNVVIWSGEDGIADTLVPRLKAMGADMTKIYFVIGKSGLPFDPSKDLPMLAEHLKSIPDVKLIIVDPVVSAINGDSHKNAEVRKGLQPLVDLGLVTGACIAGISHFNKAGANTNPLDLISGSIAFAAVARVVLGAAKLHTPDEHGHSRIFCRIKSNIGPDEDGIGYDLCLEPLSVRTDIEASTVLWGQYVKGHSRDLLAQAQAEAKNSTKQAEAEEWLTDLLTAGPVASKTIQEEAKKAGLSFRTVRRAKERLKAIDYKVPGKGGQWMWMLPTEELDQVTCPDFTTKKLGQLGKLGQLTEGNIANLSNFTMKNVEENLDNLPSGACQTEQPFFDLEEEAI